MRTTHRGATIGVGLVGAVVLCLGLSPMAGAEPKDDGRAVDPLLKSLDMQYVKQVTKHLGTIGANEDGFRVTGTPQDEETANYLADQMDAIGLEDVSVESLTTDGWLFSGGSVTAKGGGIDRTFRVSSLGGVPGTAPGGVSGRIVPVGYGTAPEYEGLDVQGKIAFAWWDYDNLGIWPNYIAYEAHAHGADAVIIASAPGNGWYTAGGGRALGSNDAECSTTECTPMVVISQRNGKALSDALDAGTVKGSVTLDAENLLDSPAHQPIGQITGSVYPDRAIVFTAHQDAWFTSAADDSVGVGMMMAIAKAAIDSGYRPAYTWIFAPVTGEEYGLADAYYDWLQGAFHRITTSHTEWTTDAMAVLNWEVHSPPYYVGANVARELRGFVGDSLASSKSDGLIDYFGLADVYSWNDGFTYTAEGAPAVTFAASGASYGGRYHTDYDALDTLNFKIVETDPAGGDPCGARPGRHPDAVPVLEPRLDPASELGPGGDGQIRRRRPRPGCGGRRVEGRLGRGEHSDAVGLRVDRATRGHQDLRGRIHRALVRRCHRLPTPAGAVRHAAHEPGDHTAIERQTPPGGSEHRQHRPERAGVRPERTRVRDGVAAPRPRVRAHLMGRAGAADDADRSLPHVA